MKKNNLVLHALLSVILLLPYGLRAQTQDAAKYHTNASGLPTGQAGFYENRGQIKDQNNKPNAAVKFLLSSPGFNVQLRQTGFSYDTYTDSAIETSAADPQFALRK